MFGAEATAAVEVLDGGLTVFTGISRTRRIYATALSLCYISFVPMGNECSEIVAVIAKALNASSNSIGIQNDEYFARLTRRISNHLAKCREGAGTTGGIMREDAFVDMLKSAFPTEVSRTKGAGAVSDADYYINGIPVSHKSISSFSGSDLALSWSKNPPGAPAPNFQAHMAVMFVPSSGKPPKTQRSRWYSLRSGVYVIGVMELELIRKSGKLKSNNKSNSIIPNREIANLMQGAVKRGHFVGLGSTVVSVTDGRISLWKLVAPELEP